MDETPEATETATVEDTASVTLNVAGSKPEIVSDDTTDDLKIVMGNLKGRWIYSCT